MTRWSLLGVNTLEFQRGVIVRFAALSAFFPLYHLPSIIRCHEMYQHRFATGYSSVRESLGHVIEYSCTYTFQLANFIYHKVGYARLLAGPVWELLTFGKGLLAFDVLFFIFLLFSCDF